MKTLFQHTVGLALACSTYASSFHVFDNTAYVNTSIGYGTTNINWIPAYVCNPLTEGEFYHQPIYPLVLDCEDLYFTDASTADLHLELMSTLQTWAADVIPSGQIIGWYGLSGNTISSLYDHYRSLIANHTSHAFFPSAYTFSDSLSTWNASLTSVLKTINAIDDSLPVWPYTWPQYHGNYSFIPSTLWEDELNALAKNSNVDGFVIWGGKNHAVCNDACQSTAGQQPWLNATRTYLNTLYGIYSGDAEVEGSQIFGGI